jgi:hypothetical protein
MKFILIWWIAAGSATSTSSAEFLSEEACLSAGKLLVERTNGYGRYICVAKGKQ